MKYKLINKQTSEETLCDKVTIDGYDYYVSGEIIKDVRPYYGKWQVEEGTILNKFPTYLTDLSSCRLVIATNNPNIDDIPKVVDEVESIAYKWFITANKKDTIFDLGWVNIFKGGYSKSQETHPYSDDDMVEFGKHCIRQFALFQNRDDNFTKRILPEWKEQKIKIIYYND